MLRSAACPVSDRARVRMGLDEMNDAELVSYVQNHIELMRDNPHFPQMKPAAADFQESFMAYQEAVQTTIRLRVLKVQAVARQAALRRLMCQMMVRRGAYVQAASNGNRQVILSSGLEVRRQAVCPTSLAAPMNLRVTLNGEAGVMNLQWDAVRHARIYLLEYRRADSQDSWQKLACTGKTRQTKTLPIGVTYVFRVAAQGSPGQSHWSAEVVRGAA